LFITLQFILSFASENAGPKFNPDNSAIAKNTTTRIRQYMFDFNTWKPSLVLPVAVFCTACQFAPSSLQTCRASAGSTVRLSAEETALSDLTQQVIGLSSQYQQAGTDSTRERAYAALALKIDARAKLILSQAKAHSERILSHPLPSSVESTLPEVLKQCIEKKQTLSGTLRILGMDGSNGEQLIRYWLHVSDGTRHELLFSSTPPRLQTGSQITVSGVYLPCDSTLPQNTDPGDSSTSNTLIVDPNSIAQDRAAETSPNTLSTLLTSGEQKVAVLLVSFQDQPSINTIAQSKTLVFDQVSNFFYENSSHQTWLKGDAFGPYTIPMSVQTCDPDSLASYSKSAAMKAGVALTSYSRIIYVYPRTSCSWLGLGTIGGFPSESWINGAFGLKTVAHELGHGFGLYHANALNCGSNSIGSNCSSIEYADTTDVMGNQVAGHFNAFHKEQLGWLNSNSMPSIPTLSASGTFDLQPYEADNYQNKALKILKSIDPNGAKTYYYIEYRQPIGYDIVFSQLWTNSNLTSGVVIHTGTDQNADSSHLLNLNPLQTSWFNSALQPGDSFQDSETGLKVALLSADTTKATLQVTIGQIPTAPAGCGKASLN
jgi:hypothetical protein